MDRTKETEEVLRGGYVEERIGPSKGIIAGGEEDKCDGAEEASTAGADKRRGGGEVGLGGWAQGDGPKREDEDLSGDTGEQIIGAEAHGTV